MDLTSCSMSLSFSSRNPSTLSVEEEESVEVSGGGQVMEVIGGKRLAPDGDEGLWRPVM